MRFFSIDISTPDGRVKTKNEARLEMKALIAKHYLNERGLAPFPVGRCWSRPYTPPAIDDYGSKLQEVLLNERVHRS